MDHPIVLSPLLCPRSCPQRNTSLMEVCLNDCLIGDDEAALLADAIRINRSAKYLLLESNSITDKGITALAAALDVSIQQRQAPKDEISSRADYPLSVCSGCPCLGERPAEGTVGSRQSLHALAFL